MKMITCIALSAVLILMPATLANAKPSMLAISIEVLNGSTVLGSGSTYQEAYKDARNRLPTGKYAKSVRTWQSDKTWYCEMTY